MNSEQQNLQNQLQNLLNLSVNHMRKQNKAAYENRKCFYRMDNGCGCAAAPFITKYDPGMDAPKIGNDWDFIVRAFRENILPESAGDHKVILFISDILQKSHDSSAATTAVNKTCFMKFYEDTLSRAVNKWNNDYQMSLTIPELIHF